MVDDDRDVADSLAALLEILDYDVCVAYSGIGALEIAGRYRPDIVILDVNMPYMDGLQTARQLKNDRRLLGVSFVAHSAVDDPLIQRLAEQTGFRHFVTKGKSESQAAMLNALSEIGHSACGSNAAPPASP